MTLIAQSNVGSDGTYYPRGVGKDPTTVTLNGKQYSLTMNIPVSSGGVFRVLQQNDQYFVQTNRGLISAPRGLNENAAIYWAKQEILAGRITGAVGTPVGVQGVPSRNPGRYDGPCETAPRGPGIPNQICQ